MNPLISVILPVYNGGHLLKEAINSVLAQESKSFEFLICDDCSTDESLKMIQTLIPGYDNIKLLRNEKNLGLFKTLNHLIHQSKAPLIHLWSQDDIMKPNCLSSTLAFHHKHPNLGLSYSAIDSIDKHGKLINIAQEDGTPELISKQLYARISIYWGCIAGNIANVTLKRSAVDQIGDFDENLIVSGDFDYWTRMAGFSAIGFNKDPNIFLRTHSGQLSRQFSSVYFRIKEDIPIMKTLLKMADPADLPKLRKAWRWKTQTMYFNELIYLLRHKQWAFAKDSLHEINTNAFIPTLAVRWIIIKLMRLMGTELWFYKTIVRTLH